MNGNSACRIVSADWREENLLAGQLQRNGEKEICLQNSFSGTETKKSAHRTLPAEWREEILLAELLLQKNGIDNLYAEL